MPTQCLLSQALSARQGVPLGARQTPAVHEAQSAVVHAAQALLLQSQLAQSAEVVQLAPTASCCEQTPLLQAPPTHS